MDKIDKILDRALLSEIILFYGSFLNFANKSEIVAKKITNFFIKYKNTHTFLIPTFTDAYLYRTNKKLFFNKNKKSKNGFFANYIIKSKIGIRSSHPTNSFYFIGNKAKTFSLMQTYKSSPFEILFKLNIKKLSFISIDYQSTPSLHLSEYLTGVSKKNLLKNLIGSYYKENSRLKWYVLKDIHGCDKGYTKHFNFYRKKKLIKTIKINHSNIYYGMLNNLLVHDIKKLTKNNSSFLCNLKNCTFCKITSKTNKNIIFHVFNNCSKILKLFFEVFFKNKKLRN